MANLLVAIEMTAAQVALNSLSTPSGIYLAQLTATQSAITIGNFVLDSHGNNWFYVGPGSRPSVQQLSGTQFLLMFEYLSHLTIRVVDISTWPPTQVDPLSVSGGPNPPDSFIYALNQIIDAFAFTDDANSDGQSQLQLSPPYLQPSLLFYDPVAMMFSVVLTPNSTWVPNVGGTPLFYRLYSSPLGPNPTWTLVQDWTTSLDYTYTQAGSNPGSPFQLQFAATVGILWNPSRPADLSDHNESAKGAPLAFNSLTQGLAYVDSPSDSMTLEQKSSYGFGVFTPTSQFFRISESDSLFEQWQPNQIVLLGYQIVDAAGHVQRVTTAGTTGAAYPAFESGPTTPDGSVTWTDQGYLAAYYGEGTSAFYTEGGESAFVVAPASSDELKFGQQPNPQLAGGNAAFSIS